MAAFGQGGNSEGGANWRKSKNVSGKLGGDRIMSHVAVRGERC